MKRIIYTRPDGGLSVVVPVEGARLAFSVTLKDGTQHVSSSQVLAEEDEGRRLTVYALPVDNIFRRWPVDVAAADWAETEDQFLARLAAKDVPGDATNVQIVDEAVIPSGRTFRNAWAHCQVNGCRIDMPKARAIACDMLRRERSERFKKLDGDWMRETAKGNANVAAEIEAKRDTLRNWPTDQRISTCAAPDELKNLVRQMMGEV